MFWIPLLMAAAAAGTQMAASQKSKSAMNRATQAELDRQKKFQEQSRNVFNESLQQNQRPVVEGAVQKATNDRVGQYEALQAQPISNASTSQVEGASNVRNMVDRNAMSRGNRTRAKLTGYDSWLLDNSIKDIRANQQQRFIGDASRQSQNLLGGELQDASHAGDTLSGISQLLNLAGTVYGLGSAASAMNAGSGAVTGAQQTALNSGMGPVSSQWAASNLGSIQSAAASDALRRASALSFVNGLGNSGLGLYGRPTYGIR